MVLAQALTLQVLVWGLKAYALGMFYLTCVSVSCVVEGSTAHIPISSGMIVHV